MPINSEKIVDTMAKISFADIAEFFKLFAINLAVRLKNFGEYLKVIAKYYSNGQFLKADLAVQLTYIFDNPFTISKKFLLKKGEREVYAYGETPLTTLDQIAKECRISSTDCVFELGCGRGRTCFWLNSLLGCKVIGIDYIPEFIERATRIARKLKLNGIEFREQNMIHADFSGGTIFFLYGTCLEDPFIRQLAKKLSKLPPGTKIITVSYPLTDYAEEGKFEVMKRFPAKFTWGQADVYLQIVK